MKVLTVVLAICMLSVIGCSNDNDAEIAELKSQIQELQQAQSTTVAAPATAAPTAATTAPATTGLSADAEHPGRLHRVPPERPATISDR